MKIENKFNQNFESFGKDHKEPLSTYKKRIETIVNEAIKTEDESDPYDLSLEITKKVANPNQNNGQADTANGASMADCSQNYCSNFTCTLGGCDTRYCG